MSKKQHPISNNMMIKTFLSCSIRNTDYKLIKHFREKVLFNYGFTCYTIGLNYSDPHGIAYAIRRLIDKVDCLVLFATVRFQSRDINTRKKYYSMSPYLEAELAMAIKAGLPIGVFRDSKLANLGLISHIVGLSFRRHRFREDVKRLEKSSKLGTYLENLISDVKTYKANRERRERLLSELSRSIVKRRKCAFCGHELVMENRRLICEFCRAVFELREGKRE